MSKRRLNELNVACLSDLHLCSKRNTTIEIIKNLRDAFPDNAETGKLDIIFIAGDVFDSLLTLPDSDVADIDAWISYLLHLCVKHNIVLRILNGTPSHDWGQSERFISIVNILQIHTDVKYVNELSIEYIEKFGINVLYVPDEWETTAEKTLKQVYELMAAKGLSHVDYAVMHGNFPYQLPECVKTQKHDSNAYLKLVKELIFIGHIHTHSRYDRIIAQGSFDRLSHGEEEPKGHIRATITNGEHKVVFIENKGAKIFKSIDCTLMSLEDTIKKVNTHVAKLPDGSHVRVIGSSDNPIFSNMNILIRDYPLFTWSKLIKDSTEEEIGVFADEDEELFVPVTITSANIKNLLMDRITNPDISSAVMQAVDEILTDVI